MHYESINQFVSVNSSKPRTKGLALAILLIVGVLGGCSSSSSDPRSENSMYQDGLALYNAKAYAEAVQAFSDEIRAYPGGPLADDAAFYLARAQYWMGDYVSAIAGFTAFPTTYPTSNVLEASVYWKGKAEQKNNDLTTARATYQYIIAENAAGRFTNQYVGDAHYSIAKTYYDAGDYTTAISEFTAAAGLVTLVSATDSKLDNIQYYLAKSYHQRAKTPLNPSSAADYTQAIAEYDLLIATYDGLTLATTSGWVGNARVQKGVIMMDQLDYAGAQTYFINLMADPKFAASSDGDLGQYTLGAAYYDQAKIELALAIPDPLIYGPLLVNARTEYAKVAVNYPTSSWADNAQYQIGKTYYDEADYVNALTTFKAVVANYPMSSSADAGQYYVGRTLLQQADAAKVVADVAAAAAGIAPDYTAVGGYLDLNAQARTELQKVVVTYPLSSLADNAQYQIGKTHYDEGSYALARTELGKVIANYATSTYADNAQYYIGRAYHKDTALVNYLADARSAYQLVLSLYPASTQAHSAQYYIARTYHDSIEVGNCVNELAQMQLLITNYPTSSHVATAQTHINDLMLATPVTHVCL